MAAYRFKDQSELLWDTYPDSYIGVAEFVTEFGGADGIILVLALLYWLTDRRKVALVAAIAVAGIALTLTIKAGLALPRPIADPTMAVEPIIEHGDDEYGFPSGHAFMAVAVYGGLLYYFDKYRDYRWLVGVGLLVVAISLTRVFLRLHYLGDLVFGALIGIGFLLLMARVMESHPERGFAIGIVLASAAVVVTGDLGSPLQTEEYALISLGVAIGGLVAAVRLELVPDLQSRFEGGVLAVVGMSYIVVLMTLYSATVGEIGTATSNLLVVLFHVVLIVGVFFLPLASHRVDNHRNRITRRA